MKMVLMCAFNRYTKIILIETFIVILTCFNLDEIYC